MRPGFEAIDALIGAAKRLLFALRWEELEEKYRPDQPREPAGSSGGGRWTGDGGGGGGEITDAPATDLDDSGNLLQDVANRQEPPRGPVSLTSENAEGGHAVRDHVGKSNAELLRTLQAEAAGDNWFGARIYGVREGSFNDLSAANQYVNDVLDSNPDIVEAVASGRSSGEFIEKRYGSSTGREAYRHRGDPAGIVRLRPTFSVGVYIVHAGHGKGFNVRTAFPKNKEGDY